MTDFEEQIRRFGGYLDSPDALFPRAKDRFSYFSNLGQEHADLFSIDGRPIQFRWISNPGFLAMAGYTEIGATVAISYGVPMCLLECFEGLCADQRVFVGVGIGEDFGVDLVRPPHLGRFTLLNQTDPIYWRECPDPDRSRIAHILSEMGFSFVLYHEFSHLLCGHARPLTKTYCIDGTLSDSTNRTIERYEEMEADWVGASVCVQQVWHRAFGGLERLDYPFALIFGLGITMGLLDNINRDVISSLGKVHPHPIHRLFGLVDSLSITLEQVLGYDVETVRKARHYGLLSVLQHASVLGLPHGRWSKPHFCEWAFQSYTQDRTSFHSHLRNKHGVAELKIGPARNPLYAADRLSGSSAASSTAEDHTAPLNPESTRQLWT